MRLRISSASAKFSRRAEIPEINNEYYSSLLKKIPKRWRGKIDSVRTDAYRVIRRYAIGYSELLKGFLVPKEKITDLLISLEELKEEYYKLITELENQIDEINEELAEEIRKTEQREPTKYDLLPKNIKDYFIWKTEIIEEELPEPIDIVVLEKLKQKKMEEIEREVDQRKKELLEKALKEIEEETRRRREEFAQKIMRELYDTFRKDFEELLESIRKIIEQIKRKGKAHKNSIEAARSKIQKIREKNNITKLPDVEPLLSYAEEQLKILSGEEQPIIVQTTQLGPTLEITTDSDSQEFIAPIINPVTINQNNEENPFSEIRDELSSLAKLTLSVVSSLKRQAR